MKPQEVLIELKKPKGEKHIVYFSSETGNTKKFVDKLKINSSRIPIDLNASLEISQDYVLFCPTYSGGFSEVKGSVPKQVIKFLNNKKNRDHCMAIVASGNTNFGDTYGLAGNVLQAKLKVPLLHVFELLGTKHDEEVVHQKINQLWNNK